MNFIRFWLALLVLSATLCQCSRCKENVTPEGVLPPETQTGANTFGCKINDSVWVATRKGVFGAIKVSYDHTYNGGSLSLSAADNIHQNSMGHYDYFTIGIDSLSKPGVFNLKEGNSVINYFNVKKNCYYVLQPPTIIPIKQGWINIKKLDLTNRIVAGTFEFTTHVQGCDTLKITEGRFDAKL